MCQQTIPDALIEGCQFLLLRKTFQAAVVLLCSRMKQVGDGALTDDYLRKGILGPKSWAAFTELMLSWKWLLRDEIGNLHRAGLLSPPVATEEAEDSSEASKDAIRMLVKRKVKDEIELLVPSIVRAVAEQWAGENLTQPEHFLNRSASKTEHSPNRDTAPSHTRESDLTLISESDSLKESDSESDRIRPDPQHPIALPKNAAFDKLITEGVDTRVLAEAARRMNSQHPPLELWKERYLRKTVKSIQAEWQGSMPMVSAVPGGAAQPSRPVKTEAEKNADEEARRAALRAAVELARQKTSGIQATGT